MASRSYSVEPLAIPGEDPIPASIVAGLCWGLALWSAYAIVEYFLLSVIPLFTTSEGVFTLAHWRLTGVLFDVYLTLGVFAGAAAGTIVMNGSRRGGAAGLETSRLPATLGLLAGVQINLCFAAPLGGFAILTFAIAATLSVAMLWTLRRPDSMLLGWVEFHPMLLAFLLIGPTWLATEVLDGYANFTKLCVVSSVVAAVVGSNWLLRNAPRWSASRHFLTGLAIATVIIVACAFRSGSHKNVGTTLAPVAPDPGRPTVVLVSLDTTRADHLSLYGYAKKTTPHLTEFAAGATVFTDAIATGNMTLPTHASIFTGVYPSWHGAMVTDRAAGRPVCLDDKLPTLAGILAGHGYATAGVAANSVFLTRYWGLQRGFAQFTVQTAIEVTTATRHFQFRQGIRELLGNFMPTAEFERLFRQAREINDEALRLIAEPAARARSFFLFVNYMDAHAPYLPEAPFDTAFLGNRPPVSYSRFRAMSLAAERAQSAVAKEEADRVIAQYDGGIAYQDAAFQQLIEGLKRRGLYDRALIIVVADHGEAFGEHVFWTHGNSMHAELLHVPLIIKYPGQQVGSVIKTPVSQVDLLPTVLDTVGYPIPPHVQGRSLRHLEAAEDRQFLAESGNGRALRWGPMKLIVPLQGKRRLYDISVDPHELHDLQAAGHSSAQAMNSAFEQWLRDASRALKFSPGQTNHDELRRLKGLGYVQ